MLLRKILLVAAVAVPLLGVPTGAVAQERGHDRATVAQANVGRAVGRPTELPPGIAKRVENGGTLPPGIARTRPQPEPEPEPLPQSEPEPEPEEPVEECATHPVPTPFGIDIVDCNGVVVATVPY